MHQVQVKEAAVDDVGTVRELTAGWCHVEIEVGSLARRRTHHDRAWDTFLSVALVMSALLLGLLMLPPR